MVAWIGCERNDDLGYGTGGSGGATASSSAAKSSSHSVTASSGHGTGGGTGGAEPNLPTALTVVNGVNDYPAIRVCFLPSDTPWPSSQAGLAFGTGQVVDLSALPKGMDLTTWIITGDLDATAGMTCSQMIALASSGAPDAGAPDGGAPDAGAPDSGAPDGGGTGGGPVADAGTGGSAAVDGGTGGAAVADGGPGSAVLAFPLATIPATTLTSDRSLLFVPMGCAGGAGHDSASATLGCGQGYASATPTLTPLLVGMSRITNDSRLNLQFVSASPAIGPVDMYVTPNDSGEPTQEIAPDLTTGVIAPVPPFDALPAASYGTVGAVQVSTNQVNTTSATSTTLLSTILATSSVTAADFVNGSSLVFVLVGASPGSAAGPFWHPLRYALVKANP